MAEATTTQEVDYFRLPRPLWRKLKKYVPKRRRSTRRGGRPRASDRAVANAIWYVLWTGCQWKAIHRDWFGVSSSVVHERFQRWRAMGVFEKLSRRMAEHYARERGGVGWEWQAMDSKHAASPLGGAKTGKNPTDKVSAVELIVCVVPRRPAHKEQHLCADKAYDSEDLREFAASAGYITHIKKKGESKDSEAPEKIHPARRWMVERTISWLMKRRSLRTRWSKKAENWLALVQLACAHILLNLAVFG
jgi:putative transposase